MVSGSLNCSALLETAALQALRKLENCSLHLRLRCLCSLLHIWIRLQEEQSNCTEKPLNCSALLQTALQAVRKLESCSLHLRLRCLCSLLHIWIRLQEKQLHRKTPKLQCTPRNSSTSSPAKASKLQCAPRFGCLCNLHRIGCKLGFPLQFALLVQGCTTGRLLRAATVPNCSSAALLCHSCLFFRITLKLFQGLSNIRTAVRCNSAGLAALSLIFISSSAMAAFVAALSSTRFCLCRVFFCKLFFFILKPATRLFSGCESLGLPGVPRRAARSSIACCSSSGVKTTSCCPLALASCNLLLARLSSRTRCRTVGGGAAAGVCILKKAPRVFCLTLCCFSSCCTS